MPGAEGSLESPGAPSNFIREPKDILVSIYIYIEYLQVAFEDVVGLPEKKILSLASIRM